MSVMVITGGTAGAGKATALRFARAGYHVALIARDETGLQETRQACERFGIKTLAISADVVDAGALQRAAAEVETTLGAIDVWINNAMTTVLAPFRQMSEEEFRRVTEVTYPTITRSPSSRARAISSITSAIVPNRGSGCR